MIGIIKFKNGNVYDGEILYGNLHGKGKIVFENGVIYEGDFNLNEIEGEVIFFFIRENIYGKMDQRMKDKFQKA